MSVETVERAGSKDRYGKVNLETVYQNLRARLERKTRRVRSNQGDTVTIDGTLMLSSRYELFTGDLLVLKRGKGSWKVFNVDEGLDLQGKSLFTSYGVTRQR